MPTPNEPTLYERAAYQTAGRVDSFLRWFAGTDRYTEETGHVDSLLGWVALCNITRDDIREWVTEEGDPWMSEGRNFSPGWYIIRINSDGLIWGMSYFTEAGARADYEAAENTAEVLGVGFDW